jgi:hypothetical protein
MLARFSNAIPLPDSNAMRSNPSYVTNSLAAATGWASPTEISSAIRDLLGAGSTAYANLLTTQLQFKQNAGVDIQEVLKDREKLIAELNEARWREKQAGGGGGGGAINWGMWAGIGAAVLLGAYLLKRRK